MKNDVRINPKRAAELLEKYFDGTSTLEEEAVLRIYFTECSDVPHELRYGQVLFDHMVRAGMETCAPEVHPSELLADRPDRPERRIRGKRIRLWSVAGIAAVIAVTAALFFPVNDEPVTESRTVYCHIDGRPVTDLQTALSYCDEAIGHINRTIRETLPDNSVFEPLQKLEYIADLGELLRGSARKK